MAQFSHDAIIAEILARARNEYGDYGEMVVQDITLSSADRTVDLADDVIEPTGLVVTKNGTTLTQGTLGGALNDYVLDYRNGKIVLTNPPNVGDAISVTGTNYQFYTDEELTVYLDTALQKHMYGRVVSGRSVDAQGFVAYSHVAQNVMTLPPVERHPVAILTAIEALWTMVGDAAYDIDVNTADATFLPRRQRYENIFQLIDALTERYKDLCGMLGNVGLWRIHDGGRLRRISQFTGRLVPVRVPREVDDPAYPVRELTRLDVPEGTLTTPAPIEATEYDPVAQSNNAWSATVEIDGVDLTQPGYAVVGTISAGSRSIAQIPITVTVLDPTHASLSLTAAQTRALPPYAPWRLTVTYPDGNSYPALTGTFLVQSEP